MYFTLPQQYREASTDDLKESVTAARRQLGKKLVILTHHYQRIEVVANGDYVGDSYGLSKIAAEQTEAEFVVFCGVHFMAESAAILCPDKTVLIPRPDAGCPLADTITPEALKKAKDDHPGATVVTYINSTAEIKALSDICCTSGNAVEVVESLGVDRVIFLPDEFLAKNVADRTGVGIIPWRGRCEVHERFTPADIATLRRDHPGIVVLAHPECDRPVVEAADYAGSTAGMTRYVAERKPAQVALITECSMSDNVAIANPDVEFVKPCNLCPHMKRITLPKIRHALGTMTFEVTVPPDVAARARLAVERMVAVGRKGAA